MVGPVRPFGSQVGGRRPIAATGLPRSAFTSRRSLCYNAGSQTVAKASAKGQAVTVTSASRAITSLLVVLVAACAVPRVRPAPFRARPDSVVSGDLLGPFDGRAVDVDTAKPIPGALVYASWAYAEGFGAVAPAGSQELIVSTDANGEYRIPRLERVLTGRDRRLVSFHLVIYKQGFVAYRSDRRFPDTSRRKVFKCLGQVGGEALRMFI